MTDFYDEQLETNLKICSVIILISVHFSSNEYLCAQLGTDPKLEDMMWASLTDHLPKTPMGITAENLAEQYKLTREEVDAFALR